MKTITLNESLEYTYEINEENQYLKINYIRLFLKKDSLKEDFFYSESLFQFDILGANDKLLTSSSLSNSSDFKLKKDLYFENEYDFELSEINKIASENIITKVRFYLNNSFYKIENIVERIEINYTTQQLFVEIEKKGINFYSYINENGNCKILFSAPFGQGKTTFLKEFFYKRSNEYEPIYLYPVNYSVANNKDIFQYIKFAIFLYFLNNKETEFKKEEFTYLETIPEFAKKNAHKLLAPFLNLIPNIGGSLFNIIEKLNELGNKYFDYHDRIQKDDKGEVISFVEKIKNEEGSLYEDNFYIELIKTFVSQIKKRGKKSVLVIDDLDRMDPEHIFRILNVFAAHFDDNIYESQSNKFGFDRIILVCDYNNLAKIFAHKYGIDTDYKGYINKFYSKDVFKFDNSLALNDYLNIVSSPNDHIDLTKWNYVLKLLLLDFISIEEMTLREIYKNKHILENINGQFLEHNSISYHISFFLFPLKYFNGIWGYDRLLKAIKKAKEKVILKGSINVKESNDLEYIFACSIIALNYDYKGKGISIKSPIEYKTESGFDIKLNLIPTSYPPDNRNLYYNPGKNESLLSIEFKISDYYNCLIQLTEKFYQMGWLK